MVVVDINVVVRYLAKDDPIQTQLVTHFFDQNQCLILKTVLLETVWVLSSKSGYNWNRALVLERLRHLMGVPNIYTEDLENVVKAFE